MQIVILHNSMEWTEMQLVKILTERGYSVSVLTPDNKNLFQADLILNRCMPYIASIDPAFDMLEYSTVLNKIEEAGIPLVNGMLASSADFNKFLSAFLMDVEMVRTPSTSVCGTVEEALDVANTRYKYPVIKKPSLSGRTVGVKLIETRDQLAGETDWRPTHGSMLLQQYTPSVEFEDYRIYICDGELMFGHRRELINNWFGSRGKGSKINSIPNSEIPIDVISEAILATKAIGAWFNACDINMTKDGPYIIENNTTPNFDRDYIRLYEFNPIEVLVNHIEDKWLS